MHHRPRPRGGVARFASAAALLVALVATAGIGAACSTSAGASFDPSAPCTSDAQRSRAYPDLEAMVPDRFAGAAPKRLDSGRNCTDSSLGTLKGSGVDELHFAGGLWETGARSGVTIAVFEAPRLTTAKLADFYEAGARTARKTERVTTSELSVGPARGRRLDTLNDESFQTIVVLDGPSPGVVRAVLVASDVREVGTRAAHDEVVARAIAAATSG